MAQAMRSPQHRRGVEAVQSFVDEHELSPGYFRGRQHVAALIVLALLAVVAFRVFPPHDVIVLNDGRAVHVKATFDPRAEALDAASVRLSPSDRVLYARGGGQSSIAVQRAKTVNIEVDGQTLALNTQATTVSGALAAEEWSCKRETWCWSTVRLRPTGGRWQATGHRKAWYGRRAPAA